MTAAEPPVENPPSTLLRVVRGNPTDAELAALVAVVASKAAGAADAGAADAQPGPATAGWAAKADLLRAAVLPGPGGWRAAARPR